MNPRIQVEHTVTEVITGIDIVRTQCLIALGHSLFSDEIGIPPQEEIPRNGYAIQARITTEDPEKNFAPDYGKIVNYRSAAGFGIRLDGAMGDTGSVITPFYDSLLVKLTASARNFDLAIQPWIALCASSVSEGLKPISHLSKTSSTTTLFVGSSYHHADRYHPCAV